MGACLFNLTCKQRSLPALINICQDTCNENVLLTCSCDLGQAAFCNLLHRGHSGQVDGIIQAIPLDLHCPKWSRQLHSEYVAEIKQSTLFLKYGCMQVQCYFRLCSIPDYDGKLQYDGQTECVLIMGRFLDVLRDFMFQIHYSRFIYSAWALHQQDAGNVDFCKMFAYTYFRLSWFSFLGLLDVNYEDGFMSMNDMCRRVPKVLKCVGTSLAYRKVHAAATDD